MNKPRVAVVKYERPVESVRKAIELSHGLEHLHADSKVFIKPNIVTWSKNVAIPKFGVITTSRVVEDVVVYLKEHGIDDIAIGEGTVSDPKEKGLQEHAFETLGYGVLAKRYGVKTVSILEGPFQKVDLGDGLTLNFSAEVLNSDFLVNLPVLKTHAQTVVSLGMKNLKGTIDIESRKKCHNADTRKDLHYMIARIADPMPPMFTLIDGIFSLEYGPGYDGRARRSNILAASSDLLSADLAGARLLGYEALMAPHLLHAVKRGNRAPDLSDIDLQGERLEDIGAHHEYDIKYAEDGKLSAFLAKAGIKGLSYPKFDSTMCTYCSGINGPIYAALAGAWDNTPWDEVEVLTGKMMKPTPGKKRTILLGKCIYNANKHNPDIFEMIPVKGCPPSPKAIVNAFHKAGIPIAYDAFESYRDRFIPYFRKRYEGKAEFDESFYTIV